MLTKYGYSTLGIISCIVIILIGLSFYFDNTILKYFLVVIPAFFLIFSLYFFRDPDRTTPPNENVLISPADGTIILVKEVFSDRYVMGKAFQISIFMSPMNVHVNRIPITGKVEYLKYIPGKYFAAFEDKASENNERCEYGIMSKFGKIFFTQVAGIIARRIVYEIKQGDNVKAGERFGMIKFGSRSDIVVPANWLVKVKKDDRVKAGETVLFEFPV
jgi:phosphatidylserine decarboxylase